MAVRTGPAFRSRGRLGRSFRQHKSLHVEAFENVPNLDVVEVGDACTTLKAGADFVGVVLEPAQRTDPPGIDHDAFTEHADLGVALEYAIEHVTAHDGADTLDTERIAHFRAPQMRFLENRIEQSGHG